MVASVDPNDTVTMRSKAFIFARVRFPDILKNTTNATYARIPTTVVRSNGNHPLKNMPSMGVISSSMPYRRDEVGDETTDAISLGAGMPRAVISVVITMP